MSAGRDQWIWWASIVVASRRVFAAAANEAEAVGSIAAPRDTAAGLELVGSLMATSNMRALRALAESGLVVVSEAAAVAVELGEREARGKPGVLGVIAEPFMVAAHESASRALLGRGWSWLLRKEGVLGRWQFEAPAARQALAGPRAAPITDRWMQLERRAWWDADSLIMDEGERLKAIGLERLVAIAQDETREEREAGAVLRLSECERDMARMERERAQVLGELEQARRELAELKAAQPRLGELREVGRVAGATVVGRVIGRTKSRVCADRTCRAEWGPTRPRAVWACPRCGGEEIEELEEQQEGGES